MAGCPTRDELSGFAAGRLSDADIGTIGAHLDICPTCRSTVEQAQPALLSDPITASLRVSECMDPFTEEPELAVVCAAIGGLCADPDHARSFNGSHSRQRPAFAPPPEGVVAIGLLGPYRVIRELGMGGMGVVYEAVDPRLNRRVALKVMRPHLAADATATRRFLREAQAAARFVNDRAAAIYDVGEDAGIPYLAMEYLDGTTLGTRLHRDTTLPVDDVIALGIELAEGLAAAHAHGLIHRDIKPDNIWLVPPRSLDDPAIRVKLLDFGLARNIVGDPQLTHSGTIVGTPAYMAPEQAKSDGQVDHRCDLFGLGCVLYRASTGVVPFPGRDTYTTLMNLATHNPTPPQHLNPRVPARLSALILSLLAKLPAERPASASVVAAALRTVHEPLPRSRRRRLWAAVAGTVFALGIGVLGATLNRTPPPNPDSEQVEAPPPLALTPPTPPVVPVSGYALRFQADSTLDVPGLSLAGLEEVTLEYYCTLNTIEFPNSTHLLGVPRQCSFFVHEGGHLWGFGTRLNKGFYSISAPIPQRGRRWHIAGIIRPKETRIFLDGKIVAQAGNAGGHIDDNPTSFKIGPGFVGTIDEIHISRRARYTTEFTPQSHCEPDADTLALFHCDEGHGTELFDASINQHLGTLTRVAWVSTP